MCFLVDAGICLLLSRSGDLVVDDGSGLLLDGTKLAENHVADEFCLSSGIQTRKVDIEDLPGDQECAQQSVLEKDFALTKDLCHVVDFVGGEVGLSEVAPENLRMLVCVREPVSMVEPLP